MKKCCLKERKEWLKILGVKSKKEAIKLLHLIDNKIDSIKQELKN